MGSSEGLVEDFLVQDEEYIGGNICICSLLNK